jgi:hypothetical protein
MLSRPDGRCVRRPDFPLQSASADPLDGDSDVAESLEAVIAAIRTAFAGTRRGAITLYEAEVIDSYGDDDERARARRLDTESSWDRVPEASIEDCPWALAHLDPLSWRFYVPAYMSWTLAHFLTNDSIVADFTIYTFVINEDDERLAAYARARFQTLDPAQSRAVCRFLRYMATHDDRCDGSAARRALGQTWGRFCE